MRRALLALLLVGGCSGQQAEQRYEARREAVDPSELWLAESLGAGGKAAEASVYVCANIGVREGFSRAMWWPANSLAWWRASR